MIDVISHEFTACLISFSVQLRTEIGDKFFMMRVLRDGERGSGLLADKVVGFGCGYVQKYTSEAKVYREIFFFLK